MLRGALVNALSFILCFANIVGICCFQTTPSIVYGIAQLKGSPGINLVQVNATDGSTKALQSVRYEAVAQELSSLDRVKNIYYIIGLNNTGQYKHPALLGFDLNNRGKLVTEVQLPFLSYRLLEYHKLSKWTPSLAMLFWLVLMELKSHRITMFCSTISTKSWKTLYTYQAAGSPYWVPQAP